MRTILVILSGVMLLGGCQSPPSASVSAPTLDEQPHFAGTRERGTAARIGVEGHTGGARVREVGEYKEPPLTSQEQAAVDAVKPPQYDDEIVFYRRPRGAADGVMPQDGGVSVGVHGLAGAQPGVWDADSTYGYCPEVWVPFGVYYANRSEAGTYDEVRIPATFGWPFTVTIGVGERRSRAGAMPYLEP